MWLPVMLVSVIATARAPELAKGVRTFLGYMTSVAVFVVPFYLRQCQDDLRFCVRLILLSSVAPVAYGFFAFVQPGSPGMMGDRLQSTFSHPNVYAFYLLLVISLALYMAKSTVMKVPTAQRSLVIAYVGALIVSLLMTQTRSAWAACAVLFVVYGLMFERRYLVYIFVAAVLAMLVPAVRDRVLDVSSAPTYWTWNMAPSNSYEWRLMIWKAGLGWMKWENYPFGYGLGTFGYHSLEFFQFAGGVQWGAHNIYVESFFETGILGVACVAWLYFRLLGILRTTIKADRLGTVIVIAVVLEYLVVSYSDNMLAYLTFNWYYWFLLGAACSVALSHQARTPAEAQPPVNSSVSARNRPPQPAQNLYS
jgi:O-antigen ligase